MKIMKKLSAFMLSLIMIVGMVPVMAVKADSSSTASAITLGNKKWVDSSTKTEYTFPDAKANFTSDGQKIFCLSVSDGGYFVPSDDVDLGSGTDVKITGITQNSGSSVATDDIKKDGKYSSISVIDRSTDSVGVVTNEKIEKFLHSLVFYRNTTDTSKVQTVTVLGNQVKLDSNMTAMAIDGVIHYYKYVEYDLSDSTSTWYTAYNEAKSDAQKFNGMRGYLATITSADEQFYLYSNITTKNGDNNIMAWIGGARTKDGTMAFDAQSISDGVLNPGQVGKADMATKWRWVCGPEAGIQFWESTANGSGGSEAQNEDGKIVYNGWNTQSKEPNSNYTHYADPMETYNQEYALEYGFANKANWNDYSPYKVDRDLWGYEIKGYLIEYSPYTTKSESGTVETIEESEPKTIPDVKKITATETNSSFDVVATNPDNPDDSSKGVAGPTEDTASSAANKYVYNIVLDSDVDNVTLTPNIENMKITSIKKGTEDITSNVTDGVVKVKDVKAGEANKVTVEYVVHDDTANKDVTYVYNITRKASTETDATVDTADETPSGKEDKSNVSNADTTKAGKKIFTITVPNDQTDVTIITTPKGSAILGSTIQNELNGTAQIDANSTPGEIKVTGLLVGNNGTVSVDVIAQDEKTKTTYEYIIVRESGADAKTEVKDPISPSVPKIEDKGIEKDGTNTVEKITITVPAGQDELTIYPNPINGARMDTKYGTNGFEKVSGPGNVISDLANATKPGLTVGGLTPSQNTVVRVKVDSADGKSSKLYEYTIVRESDTTITPVDPKGTDTGKIKEDEDPSQSSTTTDIYKVITIPSTMNELKLIPSLPERADVTKLTEDGTDKTGDLDTEKSYVVKDIVSGQDRDVVYTVETPTGTINYHYTIKKDAAPKKTSTDATVDTDDKTPSGKEDKAKVSDPDTSAVNQKKYTITVPYDQTDVTITTIPKDGATVDSTIKKNLTGTAKVVEDVSVADSIKVKDLVVGSNGTVSVDVIAEDGSTKTTYVYEIVREAGKTNTITPSLPSDSTGTITGPTEDTTKTTDDDKHYTIVLPNGTDKVTMTPKINDGDKVTSITVDGSKVDTIPADGVYTVTEVTTDKPKDLVYEITDPDGNVKRYHYTISQEKKPEEPKKNDPTDRKDPTITDITVKTDDNITTPADVKIDNNNTNKTIDVTVPSNQTDYTFTPATKDPASKITEVTKVSGPAEISTSSDGKSFTAKGLDPKTPTIVKVTVTSSTGDTATYTVTIHRAEEGVTPDISVEMDGNSMNLQDLIPEDVKQNAKEILYHCCAHTVLAIDKDGTVRSIGRSNKYKSSLVHVIVKGQDNKWTDYTIYIKVNGATKKEEYGTLVDYKGLNYEITGADTCRVSSWKTNYNTKKKNIVIPDTIKANGKTYKVTAIAPGAFMRNSKIVTIKIGKNVQEVGNTSFVGLRKIKKFTINKKNKYLKVAGKSGNKAKMILSKNGKILYSMTNMQGKVTIPSSVKQITEYAGAGNVKMTKLVIPASVKRIDPCAFAHAKKMTYVQFKGKVPEMANNCVVDQMNYKKGNVYVPKKYYKQYKSAFQAASKKRYGIKQFPAMSHLKKK